MAACVASVHVTKSLRKNGHAAQAQNPPIRVEFRYGCLHLHVLVVRVSPVSLPGTSSRWACKDAGGK